MEIGNGNLIKVRRTHWNSRSDAPSIPDTKANGIASNLAFFTRQCFRKQFMILQFRTN
jgi:hypothetical protein